METIAESERYVIKEESAIQKTRYKNIYIFLYIHMGQKYIYIYIHMG